MALLLWIVLWVVAEVPSNPDWTEQQLSQEVLPALNGEVESLEAKKLAKQSYLDGVGTRQDAFWQWSISDLWSLQTVQSNHRILLLEHQDRLMNHHRYAFNVTSSQDLLLEFYKISDQRWRLYNEVDALDLLFLQRIEEALEQHASLVESLSVMKSTLQDEINIQLGEVTQTESISVDSMLYERKSIEELQSLLIDHWVLSTPIVWQSYLDRELKTPIELSSAPGRLKRLVLLKELIDPDDTNNLQSHIEHVRDAVQLDKDQQLELEWQTVQQSWGNTIDVLTEAELASLIDDLKIQSSQNELVTLEHQIIAFKLQQTRQRLNLLQGVNAEKELQRSQQKLLEAKQQDQAVVDQAVQKEVIRLREIEMAIQQAEVDRLRLAQERQGLLEKVVQEIEQDIVDWKAIPPLSSDKNQQLEAILKRIETEKWSIQDYILVDEQPKTIEPIDTDFDNSEILSILEEIEIAQQTSLKNVRQDHVRTYGYWIAFNRQLKQLGALETNEEHVWNDLAFEWQHVDLVLQTHAEQVRSKVKDLNAWIVLIRSSIFWLLIWFGWRWLQRILNDRWHIFVQWFRSQETILVIPGVSVMSAEVSESSMPLFLPVFRIISSIVFYWFCRDTWLVSVALLTLMMTGFTLSDTLVDVWVKDSQRKIDLRAGLRQFLSVLIGFSLTSHILSDVFFAFQTGLWLQWLRTVLLFLLLVIQLGVWSEFLQEKAQQTIGFDRLKQLLGQWSQGVIGIRVRGIVAFVILLLDWSVRLTFWMIEHSSLVGATLARNTLDDLKERSGIPIDTESWSLISQKVEIFVKQIQDDVSNWKQEHRLGAMLIVADEGMGKSAILAEVLNDEVDSSVHMLSVENIVRHQGWSVNAFDQWMFESLGVSDPNQDLLAYLKDYPTTIFGIDDVQRLFLRDVSGFEVLNHLFSLVQETSDKHCWIMSCHLPTWSFLRSPSTPIQTELFRRVIQLPSWSAATLKLELTEMSQMNGVSLDFSSLSQINNPQALHRAEMAYWRLLFDASKGNPSIAKLLFEASLFQHEEAGMAMVQLFPLMSSETLGMLSDSACFVLASVLLHDHLRFSELQQSLQMNGSQLQVICRNLIDREILHQTSRGYEIYPMWLPFVEGMLLQKRFVGNWR